MGAEENVKRLEKMLLRSSPGMAEIRGGIRALVNAYIIGLDDEELSDTRSPEFRAAMGLFQGWLMIAINQEIMREVVVANIFLDRGKGGGNAGDSNCGSAP